MKEELQTDIDPALEAKARAWHKRTYGYDWRDQDNPGYWINVYQESRGQNKKDLMKAGKIALGFAAATGVAFGGHALEGSPVNEPTPQPAGHEQPAPAAHRLNQTEFIGSSGQKVNLPSHEQANETLAHLHQR